MKSKFTLKFLMLALFAVFVQSNVTAQCVINGLNATYCTNSAASTLTPGIGGGTFTGPGMSGSVFTPSVAGPGTHTITYVSGCSQYSLSTAPYATLTTAGNVVSLGDDQVSSGLPIGFSFVFFCNTYTTFYISSNGFVTFSNNTNSGCCSGASLPTNSTSYPDNLIANCWTDLYPPQGGTITYTTLGSSPNRTCVISFNGIYHYNSGSFCCPIIQQIQLFETSNKVEIHTTTKPLPTSSYITTMGIMNSGGTIAYPVAGRNASSTWTATNECQRWEPGQACNITQTTVVSPSTISVIGSNSICSGATTTLTATGNTTYSWNTGSNSASIVVSPTVNTTYAVVATNSFNCVANSAISVTVDNTPTVTANSTAPGGGVCPGSTVALTGSGATTYSWTGGIQNAVPFSVGSLSSYTLTGANACGTATTAVSISVHPVPSVSGVASSPTICSNVPVSLTGVGTATGYVWSGGIPNGTNVYLNTTATYTVIGTSALGCTNSAVTGVTVVTLPTNPPIPSPQLICIGSSATISSSGATNYTWTTPTGPVSGSSIVVSPTITSTYTLTKSNSNCVDTQTLNIFVNQLPSIFSIVSPTIVCASHTAALQAAGAQTYTWTAPSYSAIGSSPVVSPSVSTMYTVTASDGTCVNTGTVFLATNPNPTINIVPTSSVICQGDNVSLTASGAIGYSWTTVGIVSNTNNPTITETPTSSTLYQVTGINNFNCISSNQQVVVVQATPTLVINTNKPLVCSGAASNLTVNAVQGVQCTYIWSPNAGSATSSVVTVNPLSTTFYTAIGTAPNGCTATVNYPVSVFLPTFAVNNPTSSCLGGTINLIASGANSYTWNGTAPFAQISVSPPTATVYVCAATSNSTGVNCVSTQTVQVSIYSNPTITAVPSRTQICRGEETEITGGGAVSYAWNTGQTGSVVPVNPIANTVYTVVGTDINGCVGTTTVLVKTSICFGIEELSKTQLGLSIYPNPNNGQFTIKSNVDLNLKLVNEIGQLIQTINLESGNNRQVQVHGVSQGIYFLTGSKGDQTIKEKIVIGQ